MSVKRDELKGRDVVLFFRRHTSHARCTLLFFALRELVFSAPLSSSADDILWKGWLPRGLRERSVERP